MCLAYIMEQPLVTFEQKEDYLLVTGHGERNDFAAIMSATNRINEMVGTVKMKYLLVDYREVKFNTPITNVFDVVRIYETKMPDFKNLIVAVVLSHLNASIGKYWEEIAQQRGFNFLIFHDFATAEKWLLEKKAGN